MDKTLLTGPFRSDRRREGGTFRLGSWKLTKQFVVWLEDGINLGRARSVESARSCSVMPSLWSVTVTQCGMVKNNKPNGMEMTGHNVRFPIHRNDNEKKKGPSRK